ncbi:MAG: glycine oxidase ThiO [Myxococcales bacterium]|nr:glycine oxidase ThiO [Myxococcales bacterium]
MQRRSVIIGGGVMGCAIALRLAQRGFAPLVLERAVPGAEASSAAGGILAPQQEAEGPGPGFEMGLRSRALFPGLVEELRTATGVDVGYRASGLIALADEAGAAALAARAEWQLARGLRVERLTLAEAREREPALGEFALALRFPDEAQLDPPLFVRALQLAAARAGAEFQSAHVRRVLHDGQQARGVDIEGETVESPIVVVAAGSWSGLVDGAALPARAVRPMRGQMVELETRPSPIGHVLCAPGGYLVARSDGRIVVGSTMELVGFRKEVTAIGLETLCALARRVVPSLAEAPVRRFWAGFRPFTDDHLPFIGPTPIAGLHLATGHFRNGILLTPITADAVAAVIAGDEPPIDLTPFSITRLG